MKKQEQEMIEKAEKVVDPKAEARKKAKAEARARVIEFLRENAEQLGSLKSDIELFIGTGQRSVRTLVRSLNASLRQAFLEKGSLSEIDIFKQFRLGRPEMTTKIRDLTLTPNPEDRIWVRFDASTETYNMIGKGAEPPADWAGYLPKALRSVL